MRARRLAACAAVLALTAPAAAVAAEPPARLPPETLRGPENRLLEYPTLSTATVSERAGAQRLLAQIRAAARGWHTLRGARAAGFDTHTARRRAGRSHGGTRTRSARAATPEDLLRDPTAPVLPEPRPGRGARCSTCGSRPICGARSQFTRRRASSV